MKRPSLADHLATKMAPAAPAAATPETRAQEAPAESAPRPVGRPRSAPDDRRGVILRLSRPAWKQLRQLALDEEQPAHALLIEALNDLFQKRGKPPIA